MALLSISIFVTNGDLIYTFIPHNTFVCIQLKNRIPKQNKSPTGRMGMATTKEELFSRSITEKIHNWGKWKKWNIVNALWPNMNTGLGSFVEEDYVLFFVYVARTLKGLRSCEMHFASQDFESLLQIIQTIRQNRSSTLEDTIARAREKFPGASDAAVGRSIELAIRLWLGLNVYVENNWPIGRLNTRDSHTRWYNSQKADQFVELLFPEDRTGGWTTSTRFQIDGSLTLANLKNLCGLHIRWTSNLQDHLRLTGQRGHRTLSFYQHEICLNNHHREPDPIIPKPVLNEALRTFDILLPRGDAATDKLLKQSGVSICGAREPRWVSDLEEFKYWRNNMVQLLEILHGPPESLSQALLDRRNPAQWSSLWIAVFGAFLLTIVFGILTTTYSIKQYQVAIASYELSVKSFQLSVATACQQKTAPLPGFVIEWIYFYVLDPLK
jgi:hypothetical protein